MALADLTDPGAVHAAIEEFDRMGREAFLARYGFGVARRFFLATDGRHYDSKAIAGAAHGFQFPERGPLPASSFSGGEATVRRKLEGLGFTVEDVSPAEEAVSPGYWVFVCNPKKWAIDRFLAERIERDTWGIRPADRQRFASGQLALIRVGVDRRTNAERQGRPLEPGIYALCEVESTAFPGSGAADRFWAPDEARGQGWPTVAIRYLRVYAEQPLTIARLKAERPDLSPLLLNGFQASSFPIPEGEFRAILAMLGEDLQALPGPFMPPPSSLAELAALELRYLHAAPEVKERIGKAIERGPVGALVKCLNGYRCQLCEALGRDPLGFKKLGGEPYVEAHHVTPVAQRQVGTLTAGNVVTVCANHHRQLHYGGVSVEIGETAFRFVLPERSVEIPRLRPSPAQGGTPASQPAAP